VVSKKLPTAGDMVDLPCDHYDYSDVSTIPAYKMSCGLFTAVMQGLYGSWKTWKVLEFCCGIFQDLRVLEKGFWS